MKTTLQTIIKNVKKYIILFLCTSIASAIYLSFWANSTKNIQERTIVNFSRGTNLTFLSHELANKKLITSAILFKVYTKFFGGFEGAQAGTYSFIGEVSPASILETIKSGKTHKQLMVSFTIPEGFTLEQVLRRLEAKKIAPYKELKALSENKNFLAQLGVDSPNLEGFLYPETYNFFEKKPSAKECFQTMTKLFFKYLPQNYENDVKKLGLTLREAVTFASLIEKETMKEFEKPLISEVIWNRINRKMPLGIDAALIYGIEDYDGDIRWKDLKNKKNLYNTRIHRGLPPGPIGNVSKTSLEAILTPTSHGYLYYVLLPGSGGKHKFSKTLKEHNKYVKKLINAK